VVRVGRVCVGFFVGSETITVTDGSDSVTFTDSRTTVSATGSGRIICSGEV